MINKFGYKTGIAAALTLCLIFAQAGLASTVNVNLNDANQTIRGFGGMNFPRWTSGGLTVGQVDTAYGNGPGQIGLTIMRIDIPPSQSDWSGEVSAAARAVSDGAIIFATPWSPPASMKTNNSTVDGELSTASYGDFANWLTDFADYMSSNGAPLYAVSVQNEPDWLPSYESCGYTADQMRAFLDSSASVIPIKVMGPEKTGFDLNYVSTVAASPECDIVAIHLYGGGGYFSYPGKEYWMTEHYTNSGISGNVWPDALDAGIEFHTCLTQYNMNAYVWWYIRRSYGFLDESGIITKRGYCMSHFAKFVRPGYVRVDATTSPASGVYVSAFKSDANLVIVAINRNSSSNDVTFSLSGGTAGSFTKYQTASDTNLVNMGSVGMTNTLAANSINTFVGTISTGADTNAPTPDPMTWATAPAATGQSTITMTASTATDANSPPVQYYFECTTDGDFNSAWQSGATYVASGLTPNTSYSFRVRARDSATTPNVTGWSSTLSATTWPPDTNAPVPNPMTWASAPSAVNYASITMTATTATDDNSPPVKYYFECTTDGTKTSGWQSGTTYLATGLTPLTSYSFRVKARDNVSNETGWSSTLSATTPAQPTDINIINSWLTGTTHAKESGANRALIFIAHGELTSAMNLTGVTYGGQAMTKVLDYNYTEASTYAYAAAFILKDTAITAASSTTFTPTWSTTPTEYGYSSAFFSNVDQTTSIGATGRGGSTTNPVTTSNSLATSNGDMVVLGATCGNKGSYTLNNGFTEGIDQNMASSTGVTGHKKATGANETPSATYSSTINRQMIIGFVLKAGVPADLPPAAPTGFTATAGNQIVSLNWNDNSESDMNGYNLYRSTTSGTGYVKLNGSLLITSDYNDSAVTNGTTYYYVVTAVDLAGHESVNSTEVSAKPNYQNCADAIADGHRLTADLGGAGDCYVNFLDFVVLANHWLDTGCAGSGNCDGADFVPTDGVVDIYDLGDFANQWLTCNDPTNPNCTQNW
ncbi:MAG: hypothetical protein ABSB91_03490 [Sedimentisphaerales bacterium]